MAWREGSRPATCTRRSPAPPAHGTRTARLSNMPTLLAHRARRCGSSSCMVHHLNTLVRRESSSCNRRQTHQHVRHVRAHCADYASPFRTRCNRQQGLTRPQLYTQYTRAPPVPKPSKPTAVHKPSLVPKRQPNATPHPLPLCGFAVTPTPHSPASGSGTSSVDIFSAAPLVQRLLHANMQKALNHQHALYPVPADPPFYQTSSLSSRPKTNRRQ